ncbi:alanine racemase [Clostridia bacterium]|nr:alanine racemase [Clostridia bacterium]GHV32799.1 alanine racemase [Clostridia bacterium]
MRDRIWAEIDLAALRFNASAVKKRLGGSKLMAVIKADAYGHGAARAAQSLEGIADFLAVACISEAMELRGAGIKAPLLILGYTPPECAELLLGNGLTQTVFDVEYARELSDRAGSRRIDAHLKIDTGMNRLGVRTAEEGREILALPGLDITGVFTHLASSDNAADTVAQLAKFDQIRKFLGNITITHCANSGAVLYCRESWYDVARTGLLIFGTGAGDELKPVMTLKACVAQVKTVAAGERISYSGTYTARGGMKVATICAGYADGYSRALSNRGEAFVLGKRVPVVGRVCMDMLMLDVSAAGDVKRGDEATLFGNGGASAEEVALKAGTIPYEIFCSVSKRVPRIYI